MIHSKQKIVTYALIIGIIIGICCSRHDPLNECNNLIRQFDYDGARKILERMASTDSTNADALALLLRVYSLSNDTSAVDSLHNLLRASKSPIAKLSLGMFYYHNRYFSHADSQFTLLADHNVYSQKAYEWSKLAGKGQEADDLHNTAFQLLGQGQSDTAITIFSRADLLWKEINHVDARSATLCYRAFARATVGDLQGAETDIRESYRLAEMTGDRSLQIRALTIWGTIEDRKGNLEVALEKYQEAKKLALDNNSLQEQIFVSANMAITQAKMGDFLATKETYLEALSFSKKLNLERDQNISLQKLGDACTDLGQYEEAIKYYEESKSLAIKRTDPQLEAAALSGMSNVYFFQDNYEKAISLELEANKIFNKINDKRNEVDGIITIAQIFNFIGQHDKAIQTAQQALQLAESLQAVD
jgi:tetratricopeptide (TPR) repeat protein